VEILFYHDTVEIEYFSKSRIKVIHLLEFELLLEAFARIATILKSTTRQ